MISANCRSMIHQISTVVGGSFSELDNEIQEVHKLQEVYNKILSKETGRSVKQIEADMNRNYYMDAKETIAYGIADKILSPRKVGKIIIPPAKAKSNKKPKSAK